MIIIRENAQEQVSLKRGRCRQLNNEIFQNLGYIINKQRLDFIVMQLPHISEATSYHGNSMIGIMLLIHWLSMQIIQAHNRVDG